MSELDLSRLGSEDRLAILRYVVSRYGKDYVLKLLGVSKSTLYRIERGLVSIDDSKLRRLVSVLGHDELRNVLGSRRLLQAMGVVRSDGTVNYSLVMEILRLAMSDEYLKQLIIRFVVDSFREDVKKAIGLFPTNVVLHWDEGFEEFLKHYKKRKTIKSSETLKYYRSLFMKYLEGRELGPELVEYVVNHPNKWLRNVFRHYIRYLYHRRRVPLETYGWVMEVVPSRHYRMDVRVYDIDLNLLRGTMDFLKSRNELYYLYYLLMYYSGIRLAHVVVMVRDFRPSEEVFIEMLNDYSTRLACFEGFCRYYLGLRSGQKPCEWVYFPKRLLDLLMRYGGKGKSRDAVTTYARRYGLLRPKYLRKLNWRFCVRTIKDKDVCRFIQSRLGELKISEVRYGDLLEEADTNYPKLMTTLNEVLGKVL